MDPTVSLSTTLTGTMTTAKVYPTGIIGMVTIVTQGFLYPLGQEAGNPNANDFRQA